MQETKRHGFDPCNGKISCRKARQPTPVFLPGESQGHRSLVGCSLIGSQRVRHNWSDLVCKHTFSFTMVTMYFSVTGTLSLPFLSTSMKLRVLCGSQRVLCGSHCELCTRPSLLHFPILPLNSVMKPAPRRAVRGARKEPQHDMPLLFDYHRHLDELANFHLMSSVSAIYYYLLNSLQP